MGVVDRKRELFENVARLRRVGRELLPGNEDVARVRVALERELGSTVSLRLAATLLGVSHTALQRWAATGDLPVVRTPEGGRQVPVPALLDLYEEARGTEQVGQGRYLLAPTMKRRREAARAMGVEVTARDARGRGGHARASDLGLVYHLAIADRLTESMIAEAWYVLFAWKQEGRIDPRYAERWREVLAMPLFKIREAIAASGPDADDLRQSSPFAGMLSEPERRRILAEVG